MLPKGQIDEGETRRGRRRCARSPRRPACTVQLARQARRQPLLVQLGGRADLQGRLVLPRPLRERPARRHPRGVPARGRRRPVAAARRGAAAARLPGRARDGRARARASGRRGTTYDPGRLTAFALNFYSPVVEAQLRSHRKTATIRLGDKSRKYQKGMIVSVLVGARFGPRAARLRRGDRQGRGEAARRALTARDRARQPGGPPPRGDGALPRASSTTARSPSEDTVTVIRFSAIKPAASRLLSAELASRRRPSGSARRRARARAAARRTPRSRPRRSTRTAPSTTGSGGSSRRRRSGTRSGSPPRTPRTSAARRRSEADRRPVAEHLAALLAQPVGCLAHGRDAVTWRPSG